jgi:glycosyltransferase involved in cell wall biosynthesis
VAHLTPAYFSPDSYVGGGERYVDYITQAVQGVGGFEQRVFTVGTADGSFERNGFSFRVLGNESSLTGQVNGFSAALWQELPGFDLVHIHQSLTIFGAYSTAIVRSLRIPSVGTDLGGGENTLMLRGRGIELFDGVISISEYARGLLDKSYSGLHEVLVGPVDTSKFSPDPGSARDRSKVLCVSRVVPHKGIDRVIAALPPGLSLTIVGRVYHEPYYELLRRMADGKNVHFIVDADDEKLLQLYRTSGLFVQASTALDIYGNAVAKSELMGLTTLEAMACGLPAVVSNTGSLPELVPDPRFGLVFSGHDQLCTIFGRYSTGLWPENGAGALARAHVINAHSMDAIGNRLTAFYEHVISDHSKQWTQCGS